MNVIKILQNSLTFAFVLCVSCLTSNLSAESAPSAASTIAPFTGKIKGSKVRVRLEAGVDSPVLHELNSGDMVVVTGEQNDFYAIRPPKGVKAFVYRTYIIDDVVEGNRVNIRAEPSLEAPVLAQLNKGDKIGVLFDCAGFTQIRKLRAFVGALLHGTGKLGKRDHRQFQLLGNGFEPLRNFRHFLHTAIARLGVAAPQKLQIIHHHQLQIMHPF